MGKGGGRWVRLGEGGEGGGGGNLLAKCRGNLLMTIFAEVGVK